MAGLPRIVIPNQPLHIMHRGNNWQDIFESDEDMVRIKEDIALSLSKTNCHLHAYMIMTNHLHLLITPRSKNQLASLMQSMANRYVRYLNNERKRTGTIWEGRFKSFLVDSNHYLSTLYKYIEMNPVKAEMVEAASDYQWLRSLSDLGLIYRGKAILARFLFDISLNMNHYSPQSKKNLTKNYFPSLRSPKSDRLLAIGIMPWVKKIT